MRFFAAGLLLTIAASAQGQSSCSSDGLAAPVALLERFINADCETCWGDPKPGKVDARALALDWIVPAARGDEAPLSAGATRDALQRLQSLQREPPAQTESVASRSRANGRRLRVAHGLPFNGYLGASIEWKPATAGRWTAWLVLVETIPAGTEGTSIERNLVRNLLQTEWDGKRSVPLTAKRRFYESRPMSIPEGARPGRLRMVGWVEDARGRIMAIAQGRCTGAADSR